MRDINVSSLNLADGGVIHLLTFAKPAPEENIRIKQYVSVNDTYTRSMIHLAILRSSQLLAKVVDMKLGCGASPDAG
jgi:hypothetical protein